MPHNDLKSLGGDPRVDEALSAATPQIVSAGVLGAGLTSTILGGRIWPTSMIILSLNNS